MSRAYIPGIIDNIRSHSTPYTPVIEAITNAIDATDKSDKEQKRIDIYLERSIALPGVDDGRQPIINVTIDDNGIGFDEDNRNSFDTIYSPQKRKTGGKGFGRFFYLRHFNNAKVESVFINDEKFRSRTFGFGKMYDVVVDEKITDSTSTSTGTRLILEGINRGQFDIDTEVFAHRLLEKLLSYFADDSYNCPTITVHDSELGSPIVLNKLIGTNSNDLIQLKKEDVVDINGQELNYKVFKLLKPRNQKSQIVLTARNQAVTETSLDLYVPEFATDFVEDVFIDGKKQPRNYIVKYYVQGKYLDANVTTERDSFNFGEKPDVLYPVSKMEIESTVSRLANEDYKDEVKTRFEKKRAKIYKYADENVWYKSYLDDVDYAKIKTGQSEEEIEMTLHRVKYEKDLETKRKIAQLTNDQLSYPEATEKSKDIIHEVKQASISDLAQYMAFRKAILELFKTTIKLTESGKYEDEEAVHDLIFPTKSDSADTLYEGHNLWLIDERLTFTQYVSSDKEVFKRSRKNQDRPDIAAFYYQVAYRETNEEYSPISIFEFKKPGRNDFVNQSSSEDPFEQIKRYVIAIKNGDVKSIEGLELSVGDNTPFYGYIVADADKKIRDWLKMQDFTPLPDGHGWFYRHKEMNLYVEYLTWQKLIKDAEIRHRKFFEVLGVEG